MFLADLGPAGLLILLLLTCWFVLTIFNQFTNRYGAWVNRINTYGFIPGWTFFAPTPGTLNYRLLYRDLSQDGSVSAWRELDWCRPRIWLDAIWYPERYATKLVLDSINGLAEVATIMQKQGIDVESEPQGLVLSTPYIILLSLVMAAPRTTPQAIRRQMALFQVNPLIAGNVLGTLEQTGRLMLCSTAHALE